MNTVLNEPPRWLVDGTQAENEIREIFYYHWMKLKDHLIGTINEIHAWRQNVLAEVNRYADEQISTLANDCGRQRLILDEKREENLETTRAYWAAQNGELFDELRNECRSLQLQMVQLERTTRTIECYKTVTVQEQVERKKTEKSDTSTLENDKSEEKLITEPNSTVQDNPGEVKELSIKLEPAISTERNSHTTVVEHSNDGNRSINSNGTSNTVIANGDDSFNKCPICFMIFPLNMTQTDRCQHVNEHCTDD